MLWVTDATRSPAGGDKQVSFSSSKLSSSIADSVSTTGLNSLRPMQFSLRQLEFQVPIQLGRGWPVDVCPSSVQSKCRYCLSSDVLSETDRENQGLGNSIPHEMTSEICPLGGKPAIRWANRAIDESPSRVCPFRRWRNCNQK